MIDKNTTIIIDTETTGIKDNSQVLQLSIIDANGNKLFNEYFKPRGVKKWYRAEQIHHITYEMVKDCHTFKYYQKQVQKIFDGATTIIGYNINFDLAMICNYIDLSRFDEHNIIDVMPIFADIYKELNYNGTYYKWQKLTTATAYYGYDWNEHGAPHGALADVYATLYVYEMIQKYDVISFDNIAPQYDVILNESLQKAFADATPKINLQSLNKILMQYEITGHTIEDKEKRFFKILYDDLTPVIENAPICIKLIYKHLKYAQR